MGQKQLRRAAPWLLTNWEMGATHLGMVEERTTLGPANILTVARAALPAAGHRLGSAVTAVSTARGGVVDLPRSRWFRPAAAVEVLIGARVIARWASARRQRCLSGPRKP